jgi:hypothetical protein
MKFNNCSGSDYFFLLMEVSFDVFIDTVKVIGTFIEK